MFVIVLVAVCLIVLVGVCYVLAYLSILLICLGFCFGVDLCCVYLLAYMWFDVIFEVFVGFGFLLMVVCYILRGTFTLIVCCLRWVLIYWWFRVYCLCLRGFLCFQVCSVVLMGFIVR